MRTSNTAGLTFINAEVDGKLTCLRVVGTEIASLGGRPRAADVVVDLQGARLLPGLVNAHDHLQLNSLPDPAPGMRYRHVREWIADVAARRRSDREFESGVAIARNERLLIGGVKNLLSGVTTVAHHDPCYPFLSDARYPVAVVRDYGWSHSLYLDGEDEVVRSHRATPQDWPWIIHAAEGVDESAEQEFDRLDALGCLGSNTLLVHGIALDHSRRVRLERAGAGLIWCPSSNLRLFGRTAAVADLAARGRVALGTDSRLSGARDFLDELRIARESSGLDDRILEPLATRHGARLLRLTDRGVLRVGARADVLILPARARLSAITRAEVCMVLVGGFVRYGDGDLVKRAAPRADWVEVLVDGRSKVLDGDLAAQLSASPAREPGLEISGAAWRAA